MKKLANLYNWVLSLRYDIKLHGEELLHGGGPRLYLPNHQAEIDPQLLMSEIAKVHMASPMISANFYNIPVVNAFLRKLDAVPVSDLDEGVRDANVMDNIRKGAFQAFAKGHSILLYPGGQLVAQGYEKIFNKQSAYALIQEAPADVKVIGVRMQGLWGSMWSKAWKGYSPSFVFTYLKSIFFVFANLIFFLPKRTVEIEFYDITSEAKEKVKSLNRREFNAYLEEFYNKNGEEQARFIRYHFLCPKLKRKLPKGIKGVINNDVHNIMYTKISEL